MSTTTIEGTFKDDRVIPENGYYRPSMFSSVISGLTIVLMLLVVVMLIWGIFTTFISLNEFSQAAQKGFPVNPVRTNPDGTPKINAAGNVDRIDWQFYMRWSFAGYIIAIALYFPTKWLMRVYGRQSIRITNDGITVRKFPTYKYYVTWDGVIDVSVKESESIFAHGSCYLI